MQKKEEMKQQNSLSVCSPKTTLIERYGNVKEFLQTFNPAAQREIVKDAQKGILGNYPTLSQIQSVYGAKTAQAWLIPQLFDLSEYCGCREKLTSRQLDECAHIITTEFYFLKVSELMLFFLRFKASRYGHFYGSVEPMIITESLRRFVSERNLTIEHYEQEKAMARREEARREAISYEEYKKQAV